MICNLRKEDAACDVLRKLGIEVVSLGRKKFDPRALIDIINIIKKCKPSLLHLHGYASWNFGRIAGKIMSLPIVIQEHFVDEHIPFYQRLVDFILKNLCDQALAVSNAVKDFMVKERFVCEKGIRVVGNGVPVKQIQKANDKEILTLKRELNIPQGIKVVGTVGRLAEMKGQVYFINAARNILDNRDDVIFIIVGDGPLRETLMKIAEEVGISSKMIFTGYKVNAIKYITMFDVCVVPSIFGEGFCTVGIESFVAKTPLVITDLPCFKDIYVDKKNVLMIPAYNSEIMASSITELLDNSAEATRLVNGGEETLKFYDIEFIASKYIEIYETLRKKK